ncbi:hypothetical protein [Aristophania vespae]|uniref:hypothetical protein n=1 Tax=Aristophania vespae TaxID=2697033 RepID=UPI002351AA27|nr:hypothetical protein [Aristophania vespae]UMM63468.1 hypothetical protein DM15PD_04350 [Aristophania vespae]
MTNFVVLSYDLRVLCCSDGQLVAQPIHSLKNLDSLAFLISNDQGANFNTKLPGNYWLDIDSGSFQRSVPRGWITLEEKPSDQGAIRLKRQVPGNKIIEDSNNYFNVQPTGCVVSSGINSYKRSGAFWRITLDQFKALQFFIKSCWVFEGATAPHHVDLRHSTIWEIHLGPLILDFKSCLKGLLHHSVSDNNFEIICSSHDKIHRLVKYQPAILYVIKDMDGLEKLPFTLQSLKEKGDYESQLIIASDIDYDRILSFVPRELRTKFKFVSIRYFDPIDQLVPIISLLKNMEMSHYYPLIVLTPDILIKKTLRPYLIHEALNLSGGFHPSLSSGSKQADCFFPKSDKTLETYYRLFGNRDVIGSLAPLQAKGLVNVGLRACFSYFQELHFPFWKEYEADFLEYIANKFGLFTSQSQNILHREAWEGVYFQNVSSWSLEERSKWFTSNCDSGAEIFS